MQQVEKYLEHVFGEKIIIEKYEKATELPLFLTNEYIFYEGIIRNNHCVFLESINGSIYPGKIAKHFSKLKEMGIERPILLLKIITPFQRKGLVSSWIPFIVPNRQIFLPFICLDFNEKKEIPLKNKEKFTTSTQLVYLSILTQRLQLIYTAELAGKLQLTAMTINRAIRQLVSYGLVIESGLNTRKNYERIEYREYWNKGKNYLITPVQKNIYVNDISIVPDTYLAGGSGLSELTMLGTPEIETYAVGRKVLPEIKKENIINPEIIHGEKYYKLEVWRYDPGLFAAPQSNQRKIIDIYSLFAQYKDDDDPRVAIELKKIEEEILCWG